ncbi:glycosyltransferase [Aetokthonos hydrillicola Thurmond2011]|jgi:hypothetical protein|uniref:Glycosyltransferase n=1 Tax=Aetokthonos hydrillicola Thurmond2011 TaxID=2712845 RepID=A0AAP5IBW3_9CYAN|nr:glycosyltransferase family 1 protein [Aetokthonos hydrillicola]MBO3462507.1 glycosyltransferase family 1 protein [Aetokthonos hydrillicola CCALA 1050]MBW4587474.1 glycosyltransferase [Aetokthonos hydrillicola CCALA 1050]MDR9898661.1 glycosyltransferase [Aetokthonos hydrillicola Thurmond2011]
MSQDILERYNHRIYFYCDPRQGVAEALKLQHLLICLAEGFRELGVPYFSNVDYWQESPEKEEYLFRHNPEVTPDDCSIVILQNNWFTNNFPLPENLFHRKRKYVIVYMDAEDNDRTYVVRPEFKKFDFILRNHFNSKFKYGSNFYPWPFGLNTRMLRELKEVPDFQERKRQLLINFRADHTVRELSCNLIIPRIEKILRVDHYTNSLEKPPVDPYHHLRWIQTGRRHYPDYYKRLKDSAACACFGGFFVPPFPKNPGHVMSRFGRRVMTKMKIKSNTIAQWDSWRFWESLAAGCASFHVDFEKYGLALPVMPENWRHYIGIDLDNVQEAIDRIADEPEILERVAKEGRIWTLENYTPAPTALRLLQTVSQS